MKHYYTASKYFADFTFLCRLSALRYILCVLCVLCGQSFFSFTRAQSIAISPTGTPPNASAGLDVNFNNKGLLIPRLTFAQRTTPGTALVDLSGNLPAAAQGLLVYQTDAGGNGEGFYYNISTTTTPNWIKFFSGASSGGWSLTGNAGTTAGTDFIGTTDPVDWVIKTNNVERVRVDVNGNVGIGIAAPTYKLHINGKIKTDDINETSDIRLKKEIATIDNALAKTAALNGVYFRWKYEEFKDRGFDTTLQMGVIAQEIEKIIPEVVGTDADGYKSVEYSKLVALLIEAVKELKSENEALKKENASSRKELDRIVEALVEKGIVSPEEATFFPAGKKSSSSRR